MENEEKLGFEEHMDLYDQQRKNFLNHVDNNICQKCGKNTSNLNGIGLNLKFYEPERHEFLGSTFFKKIMNIKFTDKRYNYDDILLCNSPGCIVLCDGCKNELHQWLNIPIHDTME